MKLLIILSFFFHDEPQKKSLRKMSKFCFFIKKFFDGDKSFSIICNQTES